MRVGQAPMSTGGVRPAPKHAQGFARPGEGSLPATVFIIQAVRHPWLWGS